MSFNWPCGALGCGISVVKSQNSKGANVPFNLINLVETVPSKKAVLHSLSTEPEVHCGL